MKVYDYLTLQEKPYKEFTKIYRKISLATGLRDLPKDFYNLPFTPDLITKFFKGWDLRFNDEKDYYELNNFKEEICITLHHNKITYYKDKYKIWYDSSLPIVLNDFIRDCIRCKIKLEM